MGKYVGVNYCVPGIKYLRVSVLCLKSIYSLEQLLLMKTKTFNMCAISPFVRKSVLVHFTSPRILSYFLFAPYFLLSRKSVDAH